MTIIVFNGAMLVLMPWMYLGATFILQKDFEEEKSVKEVLDEMYKTKSWMPKSHTTNQVLS